MLLKIHSVFEWSEFSKALSDQIKIDKTEKQNGSDDYFFSWIKALENLIIKKYIVDQSNLNITKQKWRDAFLTTQHGHPVKIN